MAGFLKNTYTLRGALSIAEQRKDDSGNTVERKVGDLDLQIVNEFSGRMYPKIKGSRKVDSEIKVKTWDNAINASVEKTIAWKDRLLAKNIEGMMDDKLFIFNDGVTTHKFLSRYDLAEHVAKNAKVLEGKVWEVVTDVDPYIMNGRSGITANVKSIRPAVAIEGMPLMHTFENKLYFSDNLVGPEMRDVAGNLNVTAETLAAGINLNTYIRHNHWDRETQVSNACLLPFPTRVKLQPEFINDAMIEKFKAILSPFNMNGNKIYVIGFEGILKKEATADKEISINDLTAFERSLVTAGVRKLEEFASVKVKSKAENVSILTAPSFAFDSGTEIDAELKREKIFADSEAILSGGKPNVAKETPAAPATPAPEAPAPSATANLFAGGGNFPF